MSPINTFSLTNDSPYAGLFPSRQPQPDAEFDITAMIDLVFMMNIYFLVTFITAALGEINLPAATHAAALDSEKATIITVLGGPDGRSVIVYLGDGKKGPALVDADDQESQIATLVEREAAQGKTAVLLKAEKNIRLREIKRISAAASRENMTLHVAIMEKDSSS
jgi:biopolymer transport protein ExbD